MSASKQALRSAAATGARLRRLMIASCVFPLLIALRVQLARPELLLLGFAAWAYLLLVFCKSRLHEQRLRREHERLMRELAPPATTDCNARH